MAVACVLNAVGRAFLPFLADGGPLTRWCDALMSARFVKADGSGEGGRWGVTHAPAGADGSGPARRRSPVNELGIDSFESGPLVRPSHDQPWKIMT